MRLSLLAICISAFLGVGGCSGDPAPVEGDNPAAASGTQASKEQVEARGSPFGGGKAAPGTGRVGGGDALNQVR